MAKQQEQQSVPQSSIKSVDIEQPMKGMVQDMSPQAQPNGTYRFALNAVNNTEEGQQGYLSNEEGNFPCLNISNTNIIDANGNLIDAGGKWNVIGNVYIGNDTVLLFAVLNNATGYQGPTLSRLYEFNTSTCETKILLTSDCLAFDIAYQIQAVYRIRKGCERNIYFTDNLNEARQINIDSLENYLAAGAAYDRDNQDFLKIDIWDCRNFRLFPLVQVPDIDYVATDDSGGIRQQPGVYQICIRYLDEDLNPSRFFDITNPIPLYRDSTEDAQTLFNDIEGTASGGDLNTKSIRYTFSNLDTSYTWVEVAVIPSTQGTGDNNGFAYLVDSIPILGNSSLDYRFRGIDPDNATEITLDEILIPTIGYDKAKTIAQIDNRLVLGNVTSSFVDHALFQREALKITSEYITNTVPADSKTQTPKGGDYYFNGRSYMRDEVYSFGIVWVFRDGSESPAYHIPGRGLNQDRFGNFMPAQDTNNPMSPWYNAALGAQHNRELCGNAIAGTTGNWDTAKYPADIHNMDHITAEDPTTWQNPNVPEYARWKIYNTAKRTTTYTTNGGDTFHTKGEMAGWESEDFVYPDLRDCDGNPIYRILDNAGNVLEDLTGQPIRHHKMPDTTLEPHFYGTNNATSGDPNIFPNTAASGTSTVFRQAEQISILGVEFNNIMAPPGNAPDGDPWVSKIQGWKIVKQERTDFNKSIIDKGIVYYNYQARTYSHGGTVGGAPDEYCNQTDIGGAQSDVACHFWFQGNHYNKHIGLFRSNDTWAPTYTGGQVDRNPYEFSSWPNWYYFDGGFKPSLLVPSGCNSVGAENLNANSCDHGTDCGRCETTSSSCVPYANIEWGGAGWNGGQSSGWNDWASWPFHNSNTLTIGDPDTEQDINLGGTGSAGTDTRQRLRGSFTNNLSYHGAITKFLDAEPVPSHIKVELTLEGILLPARKSCFEANHMTGCDPNPGWPIGQVPEGSWLASVCKYSKSTAPYYNITNGVNNVYGGHFTWPNHNFPLANRSVLNFFKVQCQERVEGGLSDFGQGTSITDFDNCKQGDAFVIELNGSTNWNDSANQGFGMPIPGFNTGFNPIRDDNSNVGECSGSDHNPTNAANITNNMNSNNVYSTCHYVALKQNNPAQYGNILAATYIPSSNNITRVNDTLPRTIIDTNGDSFISRLAFRKHVHTKKCGGSGRNIFGQSQRASQVAYLVTRQTPYFWVETDINTDLRNGENSTEGRWYPYNFEGGNASNINNNWHDKEGIRNITADTPGIKEQLGWDGIDHKSVYGFPGTYPVMCEQYNYNRDYSKTNNEQKYFAIPLGFDYCSDCYTKFPHRLVYSQQSFQEEAADHYRVFRSENYKDVPGHRGDVWNLFVMNNILYCQTEEGLWKLFTSQQTLQTQGGEDVELGTGEFLSQPPRELVESSTGFAGCQSQWATLTTDKGALFVDALDAKVFLLADKVTEISKIGMYNWFEENGSLQLKEWFKNIYGYEFPHLDNPANPIGVGYITSYDANNQRYIVTKKDYIPKAGVQWINEDTDPNINYAPEWAPLGMWSKNATPDSSTNWGGWIQPNWETEFFDEVSFTISYSILTDSWTSFHSYLPNYYIAGKDTFISGINHYDPFSGPGTGYTGAYQQGYKHGLRSIKDNYQMYYGPTYPFIVDVISVTSPLMTEIYDNYHLYTKVKEYNVATKQWIDRRSITFDQVMLYNDYQATNLLTFTNKIANPTNMLSSISTPPGTIILDKKERTWSFNGFRDEVVDRNTPIFSSALVDILNDPNFNYYIDKVPNPIAFAGTRNWNESQRFRDKYLGIRLFFSNLAGSGSSVPRLTFNYLQSGSTKSIR